MRAWPRPSRAVLLIAAASLPAACARAAEPSPPAPAATPSSTAPAAAAVIPTPAPDPGAACADVGELRVCWEGGAIHAAPRPLPTVPPASAMGWRCTGVAARRVCASRAAAAPAFSCAGARCEQRHPRMPDDGEWQCADSGGATICTGGERAAGVAVAPGEAGWSCGPRRGAAAFAGERVCVDLSPDFPDGRGAGWRCANRYDGPVRRVCQRDPDAHALGERCDARRPCLDGARCAGGWCAPERPAPACWLQGDCADGRCRFGSCLGGGT